MQLTEPRAGSADSTLPSRHAAIALVFILIAIWFGTLDYRKLIKPDEGRYAEIAREMVVSGNWLTPRLNGLKYFEKPPLQYWATALAYEGFGVNEWTARLWAALTGFFGVAFAGYTANQIYGGIYGAIYGRKAGLYAAAVLASTLLFSALARFNTLDMALASFMAATLFSTLLARNAASGKSRRRWMLAAWAAMALAVMSKGLIGLVLPGAVLVAYVLASRDWVLLRMLDPVRGLLLFLAIAAPWFIAVSIANPEFPRFFFIHEHFQRFLTSEHRRTGAWWYFIPILVLGSLPWVTVVLSGLVNSLRWGKRVDSDRVPTDFNRAFEPASATHFSGQRSKPGFKPGFRPDLLLVIWSVLIFVFFSVSGSKLPSYILPIFPALALLAARELSLMQPGTFANHLWILLAVALAGSAVVAGVNHIPRLAYLTEGATGAKNAAYQAYRHWILGSLLLWTAGIVVALVAASRQRMTVAVLSTALFSLIAWTGLLLGHEELRATASSYDLAARISPLLGPAAGGDVPFYSIGMYDHTLDFYLGRTVTLVDFRDEMDLGLQQEPEKWVPTVDAFRERWALDPRAFAIMGRDVFATLRETLPSRVVFDDGVRVVVTKP